MAINTVFYEGRHTGEYIKSEAAGCRSRDNGIIAAGSGVLPAGQVLGRITAAGATMGQFAPMKPGASDGSQTAVAILYANVDATLVAVPVAVTARDCEVYGQRLTYDPTVTTPAQFAAAAAQLAAADIILR